MTHRSVTAREGEWLPAERAEQALAPFNPLLAAFPWLQLHVIAAEVTLVGDQAHIRGEARRYEQGRVSVEPFSGTVDVGAVLEAAQALERQVQQWLDLMQQQALLFNPWLAWLPPVQGRR